MWLGYHLRFKRLISLVQVGRLYNLARCAEYIILTIALIHKSTSKVLQQVLQPYISDPNCATK